MYKRQLLLCFTLLSSALLTLGTVCEFLLFNNVVRASAPVSYTHLDVYKRQELNICAGTDGYMLVTELTNLLPLSKKSFVHVVPVHITSESVSYTHRLER